MSVPAEYTRPEIVLAEPAASYARGLEERLRHAVPPMPPSHAPHLIGQMPLIAKQTFESPISYAGTLRRATAWARKICTSPVVAGVALRDG
jgi:hypothetical protein